MQKPGLSNTCFIGADVVSLFPSLKAVEAARLARCAILNSNITFEDFDYHMALRYLSIIGGREMLEKAKLGRLAPKWKGSREDLISVGGKKSKDEKFWRDTKKDIWDVDKRVLLH